VVLLLALLGLRWFARGLDHSSFYEAATGVFTVASAVAVAFVRPAKRTADHAYKHVVGGLANVLSQLGQELSNAQAKKRSQDSVKWGSAQLEISVLIEKTDTSGVDIKVVSGEARPLMAVC
jgi:hypothetical protein